MMSVDFERRFYGGEQMAAPPRRAIGIAGETAAADYLMALGVDIECRNYRTKRGELDLVGRDDGVLVFYEVKTVLSTRSWASPVETVSKGQLRRIVATAMHYMVSRYHREVSCRFDVVAVRLRGDGTADVQLISPAFLP